MKSVICPKCGMHVCHDNVYHTDLSKPVRCPHCGCIAIEPDECYTCCDTIDYEELSTEDLIWNILLDD